MTQSPNFQDLKQYDLSNGKQKCVICSSKDRVWIESARGEGHGFALIANYLTDKCGYAKDLLTEERIRGHFRRNHHLRSNGKK